MDASWWVLLLAVIGGISIVGVAITLFSALGDRPKHLDITLPCAVDSPDFLLGLAGNLNIEICKSGDARLLNNGNEYLPALEQAVESARHSINFMVYIWEPGEMSDRVFQMLTRAAESGVQVRVMADGLGGRKAPDEDIERLRRAGGEWCVFQPPRFGKLTRFHKRNHRRAIVIDGRVGFTGGIAVLDKWLGDARHPGEWRDAMVEVRGTIARNLQSAFCQLWSHVTGEILMGEAFFPQNPDGSEDAASSGPCPGEGSGDTGTLSTPRGMVTGDDERDLNKTKNGSGRIGEQTVLSEGAVGPAHPPFTPIRTHLSVVSSPSDAAHPLRRFFWTSFRAAREKIYIVNPYFVPDHAIGEVLKERAAAGVDVRVLVPSDHNDVTIVRWASQSYYDELLSAGLRIFEYQPTMIHYKLVVVDGIWSIFGSANLDVRSKQLNQENVFGFYDREFGQIMETTMLNDLEDATEIDLEEWRRRPALWRVRERFGRLFEEQA